jgi:hypothetical protein
MDYQYRVTTLSNLYGENNWKHYPVLSLHEAKTVIEAWANESLLNKHVDFNMATVEEYNPDTGMWEDWYDEEGLDYEDTEQKDFV